VTDYTANVQAVKGQGHSVT